MPEEKKVEETKDKKKKKNDLEDEVVALKAQVEHWKNEYYRAFADTKNLRDSLNKEHQKALKYRAEGFIDNLLPVLDSFYMVLANEPDDPMLKNYLIGFQYIYKNMVAALESEGVSEITPVVGKPFDVNTMSATEAEESDGEENIVLKVQRKGYKLHDLLIRPASVVVSKKKVEEVPQEEKPQESETTKEDA